MILYLEAIETDEDKKKFEQLYTQYKSQMYFVALKILENEYDAEDAVHQAFTSIIEHLDKISFANSPQTRAYVVITAERKALDIIRSKRKLLPLHEDNLSGMSIPLPGDSGLADALSQLPAKYREVLLLRFDTGYKTNEIASILKISQSNVKKMIWRAKKMLLKQLEGTEITHEQSHDFR